MLEAVKPRVIRDKAFAKRIEMACEGNTYSPSGHGRQKWVRDRLGERGQVVSAEAVRKWFAGESRPKPPVMKTLAAVLEVDEAWLSLGLTPTHTPEQRKQTNAMASGAVNMVAGQIQIAGGTVAFSDGEDVDLYAIIRGKKHNLIVRLGTDETNFIVSLPARPEGIVILVVPTYSDTLFTFAVIPPAVIEAHGKQRGGFIEIRVTRTPQGVSVGRTLLPVLESFEDVGKLLETPEKA